MKNISIKRIIVEARSGSAINDCIQESIELAVKENRNVVLIHNDFEYKINPSKICENIYDQKIKEGKI